MKIAPLIGFPGRFLTKTTIRQNLLNAETQVRTLLAVKEKFQPDIIFTFMDLSVEAQAVGLKVDFPEDDSPNVIEHPVKNEAQLEDFGMCNFDKIFQSSRMKLFTDVVRQFKKRSSNELSAYVIGPFSFAGLLTGATELMLSVIGEPKVITKLLNFTTFIVTKYVQRLADAGADYITILEPTAVMLSPSQFVEIVVPRIVELAEKIGIPAILHICGDTSHLFDEFRKLNAIFGLSLDSNIDLRLAYERTGKLVIGNVNPVTVARESKEQIVDEILALIKKMHGISDFVLSTGCDLPPETPLENISLFRNVFAQILSSEGISSCPAISSYVSF